MTEQLIGAVAIEDEEISFAVRSYGPDIDRAPKFVEPDKSVLKPEIGYDKIFIEKAIKDFFENTSGKFAAIGISMFGVIDTTNCTLLDIPGRDWSDTEFKSWRESATKLPFKQLFPEEPEERWKGTKISVCNDATTAALGESSEHDEGSSVFAYVRVGSGINAGVLRDGRPLRYRLHPEIGHIRPMRHFKDLYHGCCTFHNNCFEGLASLRAITGRMGLPLSELDKQPEHEAWRIQAYYLAQICIILNMTVAPNCIIFGGNAMRDHIFDLIRDYFEELVGNYPRYAENRDLLKYIRPAKINNHASLRGAMLLAHITAEDNKKDRLRQSEPLGC